MPGAIDVALHGGGGQRKREASRVARRQIDPDTAPGGYEGRDAMAAESIRCADEWPAIRYGRAAGAWRGKASGLLRRGPRGLGTLALRRGGRRLNRDIAEFEGGLTGRGFGGLPGVRLDRLEEGARRVRLPHASGQGPRDHRPPRRMT